MSGSSGLYIDIWSQTAIRAFVLIRRITSSVMRPADGVEVDVDPVRAKLPQPRRVIVRVLRIQPAVESQFARDEPDLLVAADHARSSGTA